MGCHQNLSAENGGDDGSEFDFIVSKTLFEPFTLALKYANYQADGFATDTEKLWLSVGAEFRRRRATIDREALICINAARRLIRSPCDDAVVWHGEVQ